VASTRADQTDKTRAAKRFDTRMAALLIDRWEEKVEYQDLRSPRLRGLLR
jgi:hypothetical protein